VTAHIGVVIPVHNGARYLAPAIESVLAQTRTDWSLVVVDDGSKDDSAAIAERYCAQDPRVTLIRQAKSGVSVARNRGLSASDPACEYVAFLDSDDVWEPDALAVLSAAIKADPSYVAAHGHTHAIDEQGRAIVPDPWERWKHRVGVAGRQVVDWPLDRPTTFEVLILHSCIRTGGSVLIRRRVLEAVGGYEPGLTGFEDWHLWLRLVSRGPMAFVNRSVLAYRMHGENTSNDFSMMARTMGQVRWKILRYPTLTDEQRHLARFALHRSFEGALTYWWGLAKEDAAARRVRSAALDVRRSLFCLAKVCAARAWLQFHQRAS
jgi:glycosyltransferase involved in cell wall biosynthesis